MTVLRGILKVVLVIVMILGLTISIANFLSIESQAKGPEGGIDGTVVILPDGRIGCQGEPDNC
jgi:hypothetical protein